MDTWFGLPAHPFFVHAPLVLTPLVAVAAVAIAVRDSWRRRYGWVVLGASFVVLVLSVLATNSGESLQKAVEGTVALGDHPQLGRAARLLCAGLFVFVAAVVVGGWWVDRRAETPRWARPARIALSAFIVLFAVASTIWMVRAGHSGAEAVWSGTKVN